jgi:hypothetical protein
MSIIKKLYAVQDFATQNADDLEVTGVSLGKDALTTLNSDFAAMVSQPHFDVIVAGFGDREHKLAIDANSADPNGFVIVGKFAPLPI